MYGNKNKRTLLFFEGHICLDEEDFLKRRDITGYYLGNVISIINELLPNPLSTNSPIIYRFIKLKLSFRGN